MAVGPGAGAGSAREYQQQYEVQGVVWQVAKVSAARIALSFPHDYLQISPPQIMAAGRVSVDQRLTLPRNAVVRSPFPVTVQAGQAQWIRAGDVGHIRITDVSGDPSRSGAGEQDRTSVTVDFGGLRTVSAVGLVSAQDVQVLQVKQWTGAGFAPSAVVGRSGQIDASDSTVTPIEAPEVPFPSEIRSERLQVVLAGTLTEAEAGEQLLLLLPDLPADLQIAIDGGAPVWSAPGPVREGVEGWELDEASGLFRQQVDLAAALTRLLGDPTTSPDDEVELRITLQAAQPGILFLSVPAPGDPAVANAIRYRTHGTVEAGQRESEIEAEGLRTVSLQLPTWVDRVESVEVRLSGELEPPRILPPVGPDFPTLDDGATPRVEMRLDANRAAAVRLPDLLGLDTLEAVRLPLVAVGGSAEVQAILLEDTGLEPGENVDDGVSDPATVSAGDHHTWHTLTFPEPVEIDPVQPPMVAIAVSRGTVAWALTGVGASAVWQGPITGPWLPLPPLRMGEPRGRIRGVGTMSGDGEPVAPLLVGLGAGSATVPLTPTPEGAVQEIRPAAPIAPSGGAVPIELVARATGTVRVEEAVAVVTKSEG